MFEQRAVSTGSGERIGVDRQAELAQWQQAWEQDAGRMPGPYTGRQLTGGDVFWLAAVALAGPGEDRTGAEQRLREAAHNPLLQSSLDLSTLNLRGAILSGADLTGVVLPHAHLEQAVLGVAHLDGAFLSGTHLAGAFLDGAHLDRAILRRSDLSQASLWGAHLSGVNLYEAQLNDAILCEAHLEDADLRAARMDRADLRECYLEGADLAGARLDQASLFEANLKGAVLSSASLVGCDLRRAACSATTRFNAAQLDGAALDQVELKETNLAVVSWHDVARLGDEIIAEESHVRRIDCNAKGERVVLRAERKTMTQRAGEFQQAARAYRSLSVALQDQGITTAASRVHYLGEVMQRKALFYEARTRLHGIGLLLGPVFFVRWFLSLLLGVLAGYGIYKVWRLLVTYLVLVSGFAVGYYLVGLTSHVGLTVGNALLLSLTSFHGRGVQPIGTTTPAMQAMAGAEAICGLLVEALLIAAFTRRVTGT